MLLGDAVRNGINLILLVGGFIIFFAVITQILKLTGILDCLSGLIAFILPLPGLQPEVVASLLIGILEVTNGIRSCAALHIPLLAQLLSVSFMIGFGGLSVNAQVLSLVAGTDLNFGLYLMLKVVQGLLASLFTFFLYAFMDGIPAFSPYLDAFTAPSVATGASQANWLQTFMHSTLYLILALLLLLALHTAASLKKLRH